MMWLDFLARCFRRICMWLLDVVTGKTELERICLADSAQYLKTIRVEKTLNNRAVDLLRMDEQQKSSPMRGEERGEEEPLLEKTMGEKRYDPRPVLKFIVQRFGVKQTSQHYHEFERVMFACLTQIQEVRNLIKDFDERRRVYDGTNEEHEAMLMKLWDLLRPEVRLSARKCKEWEEIGFQGCDPATDFRSMGVLSLEHLISFAEGWTAEAKAVLSDCRSHQNWFGFALLGINLTADMRTFLSNGKLSPYLYQHGVTKETLDAFFASFMVTFNECWTEADPENVMSYQPIHEKFLARIDSELSQGTFQLRKAKQTS